MFVKVFKHLYLINILSMDKSKEENAKIYILKSKQSIDTYINRNEFRKAFGLLILVLERLDENEKNEFIDYYSKNMANMGIFNNRFPSR
jgi:hypothetical protein